MKIIQVKVLLVELQYKVLTALKGILPRFENIEDQIYNKEVAFITLLKMNKLFSVMSTNKFEPSRNTRKACRKCLLENIF